jgi:GNAT superfamily N-acetyltransferase
MEWVHSEFLISDDPTKLDLERIHQLLSATYWAGARGADLIATSIRNSVPLGLYHKDRQIGFARIVTDRATFAWICDVVIDPDYRGKALGKWLVETVIAHPAAQVSLQLLRTKDAHTLYEQNGFVRTECLTRRPNPAEAWETSAQ